MNVSPLRDATLIPEGCDIRPPGLVEPAIDGSRLGGPLWFLSPASHWLLSASMGDWETEKGLPCLEDSREHCQLDSQNHGCKDSSRGLRRQDGEGERRHRRQRDDLLCVVLC